MCDKTGLKLLFVGNSFSVDTVEYLTKTAQAAGIERITVGNLYIGGCSVTRHFEHVTNDAALYEYYLDRGDGNGFAALDQISIKRAVLSDDWDVIAIQNGTADGSRNTDPASYAKLPALAAELRRLAGNNVRIVFNMTWVGESYHSHPEIRSYDGDTKEMYRRIAAIARDQVAAMPEIDTVSPTGTAIENARAVWSYDLTRDGYHLSFGLGRYIASLIFFKAVTGLPIDGVTWRPDSVSEAERAVAIKAANDAWNTPFAVTV